MTDKIRIEFQPLEFELGGPPPFDRLLGIQGRLRITVGERKWFDEPMFPVVELAVAVRRWLPGTDDLEFETLEADDSPFLWVRSVQGGCLVGAAWELFPIVSTIPCAVVRAAFQQFADAVPRVVAEELNVDVSDLMDQSG